MPRKHERTTQPIEIELNASSGRREARISDISLGGCFVDSIATASEGEVVTFEAKIAGNTYHVVGEVAYVFQGVGFGVKFTEIPDELHKHLSETIGHKPN